MVIDAFLLLIKYAVLCRFIVQFVTQWYVAAIAYRPQKLH